MVARSSTLLAICVAVSVVFVLSQRGPKAIGSTYATPSQLAKNPVACSRRSLGRMRDASAHAISRRQAISLIAGSAPAALIWQHNAARADTEAVSGSPSGISKVFVAGATGNTGKRAVDYLKNKYPDVKIIAGVRSLEKAKKLGIADGNVELVQFDVTSPEKDLEKAVSGVDAVICATGFVPGNPFEFSKLAHAVDNEGTIKLVDAAKNTGVKKFVLISSILTNGREIGQEKNPGFVITNAFGGALDEKLVAEKYLRKSGLDFTIVRPGGLKDAAPSGSLVVAREDTTFTGEISRDRVAQVLVEATFDRKASQKVIEIIEEEKAEAASSDMFGAIA